MSRTFAGFLAPALALMFGALGMILPSSAQPNAEVRLALVIAQTNYSGELSKVTQAEAEAKLIADALTATGFRVTTRRDLHKEDLRGALDEFRASLERAGANAVGFVYYTGHGVQHPQTKDSYLLGVDARLTTMSDLAAYGINMESQRDGFAAAGARAVFLVFDACRNMPAIPGFKATAKGLARVDPAADMLIAFSTSLDSVAEEGVYAPVLAEEIRKSGRSAAAAFEAAQVRVAQRTGRRQLPWTNNLLYNEVCFAGCDVATASASISQAPPTAVPLTPVSEPDSGLLPAPASGSDVAFAQLRDLLGKPLQPVTFPGIGVVRNSGAVFVDDAASRDRTLMIGEGLELIGYGADQKTFRAKHVRYGTGRISIGDVAVQ